MTRANKVKNTETSNLTSKQLETAIAGINRLFKFEKKEAKANLALARLETPFQAEKFILSCVSQFKKSDFTGNDEESFTSEEKAVLKAMGLNTYEKPAKVEKEKAYTRASALADAMKALTAPATKHEICLASDKLFREKNVCDAISYEDAIKDKKSAVAEQFFRYAIAFAVEAGFYEETGKGENKTYFPPVTETETETSEEETEATEA